MALISWLHLSDWHQEAPALSMARKKVRDALLDRIRRRRDISRQLARIDLIFFTGDLASAGLPDEYHAAQTEFLDPVLTAANVSRDRLFLVPGNHDLEWSMLDTLPDLTGTFISQDAVSKWLEHPRKRHILLEPMGAYTDFVRRYLGASGPTEPAYSYTRIVNAGGVRIAVTGLNSAWFSGRHKTDAKVDDRGFLIVGESAVYEALSMGDDADIRFVLLHHPFDWLVEFERHRLDEELGRRYLHSAGT